MNKPLGQNIHAGEEPAGFQPGGIEATVKTVRAYKHWLDLPYKRLRRAPKGAVKGQR